MRKHFLLLFLMALLPLAGWGQKDLGLEVLTGTTYNGSTAATAPVISVTTPTMGYEISTNTNADYYYTVTYHNSASDAQSGSSARALTNLTPGTYYVRVTGHGSYYNGNNWVYIDNHYNYAAFTVAKADLTITRKDHSYDYGAKAVSALTYTDFATVSGGKSGDTFTTIGITGNSSNNVGTYNIDLSVPAAITNKYNITYAGVSQPKLRILQKSIGALTNGNIANIADQTYSGSAINPSGLNVTATLLGVDNTSLVEGTDYTLSYLGADYTNVGEKTITLNGIGNFSGTTTKTFNIIPKSLTAEASAAVVESVGYDGSEKNPGLVVTGDNKTLTLGTDYNVTWKRGGEDVTSLVNAGVYTATIAFTGNYSGSITSPAFTISKATATLTAPVLYGMNEDALTYNGDAQAIIKTPASATGTGLGTIKYKVGDGETWYEIGDDNLKATNVGEYTVYYKMEEGDNYNAVNPASVNANAIAKAAATITPAAKTKNFGAVEPAFTATVVGAQNGEELVYTIKRKNFGDVAHEQVGTYSNALYVEFDAENDVNKNYTITTGEANFKINPKGMASNGLLYQNIVDQVYDATKAASANGITTTYTLKNRYAALEGPAQYYTLVEGTDFTVTYTNNTAVGVATVTFKGAGTRFNNGTEKPQTFNITAKPVTLTAKVEPASVGYGSDYTPGVTWGAEVTDADKTALGAITYSYKKNNNGAEGADVANPSEVGKYFVYANFTTPNANYSVTATKGEFEITAGQVIASISATATYGSLPTFTLTHVSGLSTTEAATFNATNNLSKVTIKKDGEVVNNLANVAKDNANLATLAAGEYDLEATASCGDSYTVIVSAGKLNVSANDAFDFSAVIEDIAAVEYKADKWEPEVTVTGLTAGTDYTVTYGDNTHDNIKAGEGIVKIAGAGNYAGATGSKTFTINKANLTITADNRTGDNAWTYGKAEFDEFTGYTATVSGLKGNDALAVGGTLAGINGTLKVKRTSSNTVGMHTDALVAGFYDANDIKIATPEATNYNLAFNPGDLQVVKGAVVIQLKAAVTATYGEDPATSINAAIKDIASYEYVSGLSELEAANFASIINVGAATYNLVAATKYEVDNDYTFTVAGATSTNYAITINDGTYKVNPSPIKLQAKDQDIDWSANPTATPNTTVSDATVEVITSGSEPGLQCGDGLGDVIEKINIESTNVGVANRIYLTAKANKNYSITVLDGVLTVTGAADLAMTSDYDEDDNWFSTIQSYDGKAVNVTIEINRTQTLLSGKTYTWKGEEWNAFILPFAITPKQLSDAFGYAIVNVVNPAASTANNIAFKLNMSQEIPANTPFMLKNYQAVAPGTVINFGAKTIDAPESKEVSVDAGGGWQFIGSYDKKTIDNSNTDVYYYNGEGAWKHLGATSTNTWNIAPFNAYMLQPASSAPAQEVTFTFEDLNGNTTAIKSISEDATGTNAKGWYDLKGMKMENAPTQKGVYIKDGKKVVIK